MVITHRCTGTSLVSCEHYLLKRSTSILDLLHPCCIRACRSTSKTATSCNKDQRSTLQAFSAVIFWCGSTFMNIHDSTCFTEIPQCWCTSSPRCSTGMCPALPWVAGLVRPGGERGGRCSLVQASEGFRSLSPYQQQRFGGKLRPDSSLIDIRLVSLIRVQANVSIYRKMSLKFLI